MKPDGGGCEIVRTIVALAQNLDLHVIAEGVETAMQRDALRELRCEFAQGFMYSRPVDSKKSGSAPRGQGASVRSGDGETASAVVLLLAPGRSRRGREEGPRPGLHVERVEPGILLADRRRADGGALRDTLRKAVKTFRERALDVPPQNSLLIINFGSAESYRAYTAKRYGAAIPQTTYYDVLNRRVLLRTEAARAYALQAAASSCSRQPERQPLPPWIAAALSVLDDPDPGAGDLRPPRRDAPRGAPARTAAPAPRFFALDLGVPRPRGLLAPHVALAQARRVPREEGRAQEVLRGVPQDLPEGPTGAAAVEPALGGKLDAVEKDFAPI
jgi:hypothetical protein